MSMLSLSSSMARVPRVSELAAARQRSRAHGVAGNGSTMTVICPLGVRRAGELIARRHLERQPEALARHHQRRPEDLRHVVQVPQQQDVVDAERQADRRRAGSRPCRRPCGAPRCPAGSRTARRAMRELDRRERGPRQRRARSDDSASEQRRAPATSWRAHRALTALSRMLTSCTKSSASCPYGISARSLPSRSIR